MYAKYPCAYLKVSIGKGILTYDELAWWCENYVMPFANYDGQDGSILYWLIDHNVLSVKRCMKIYEAYNTVADWFR